MGEATLPTRLDTDTPELRQHWVATMQLVASRLWLTKISPERLTFTRDRTSLEPLIYVKLDLPDLAPMTSAVTFPVPPGIAHITVAGRLRVPEWSEFWKMKHRVMAYMTERQITIGLTTTAASSFNITPHCEMFSLITLLRTIIAGFHIARPGEEEEQDLGADVGIWLPGQHITFYTLVEAGAWTPW